MTLDNPEKQIKRQVIARQHQFYAVAPPGFEKLCAEELARLPAQLRIETTAMGGVAFSGRLQALYAANLHLKTAGRVLFRLAQFKATNFRHLEKRLTALSWQLYLPQGCVPACKVTAHQSRLYHSQAVAEHTVQAIRDYWQDHGIPPQGEQGQTLYLRIQEDVATLSLDSSGPNLYLRGIKTHAATAPLRETMAAAILELAGYDPARPFIDPMCGAGTFSLEAALWAKQIPPGAFRDFAFRHWPAFREPQWRYLKNKALEATLTFQTPMVFASDLDAQACERLSNCIDRHSIDDVARVRRIDFFELQPTRPDGVACRPGLIVLNPPYGRRLAPNQPLASLYQQIGRKLKRDFRGWRVALLAPLPSLARQIPFPLKAISITHGGLQLTLLLGRAG